MSSTPAIAQQLPLHSEALWRFACRLTRNNNDAADLVQKTCVRALERAYQFDGSSKVLSWLFKIQHSIWVNELKKQQRYLKVFDSTSIEDKADRGVANDSEQVHASILLKQVFHSVDQLPEAQRVVMILVCVEDMSYKETANILDIPIGTVMSRLAAARLTIGQRFSKSENQNATSHSKVGIEK